MRPKVNVKRHDIISEDLACTNTETNRKNVTIKELEQKTMLNIHSVESHSILGIDTSFNQNHEVSINQWI